MTELLDLLPEDGIVLGAAAKDWRELTETVGELLVDADVAEPSYTGAMIRNVETNGPYLVIAPGLALLHARPEEGARAPGLVLVTPRTPIEFGHSTNDPVRVALGLTAVDATGHLDLLGAIGAIFTHPDAVDRIAAARTSAELRDVVAHLTEEN
ncbi:PTS sugar transporter subunit IIA [Aeromicrobium sp. YIM 150415]|uniref:PTS sugar transporter subunit IIA n=1 Tax=Aeromicrobium sp. YIM 150415 TaxID=2803912 RepID=UPI00196603E0|nr:PTS sugar transporter subunit IIA [Aeromicrobium sp. YIM 150415]MBM9465247.1 PTS sugar transporter subunit IIA [Aeromicrobium sp. YIM 150415]